MLYQWFGWAESEADYANDAGSPNATTVISTPDREATRRFGVDRGDVAAVVPGLSDVFCMDSLFEIAAGWGFGGCD